MIRRIAAAAVVAAAAVLSGCSAEEELHDVSGTLTFEGTPIPKGLIYFDPDTAKGTPGTQGFANIENGRFDTSIKGKGRGIRGGGPYLIRISGFDGKEAAEAPMGQPLFNQHELTRDLPAEKQTFEYDVKRKR
ncbi:MAG TPA: hypothetical protein VM597_35315 [Gemmataceae bacterium]|jgi:hypothetical protein|nr:hypothetical protein [Gemmataceae bacterium]